MQVPEILLIDNFDSFTHTIGDYLQMAGAQVKVVRRNLVSNHNLRRFDGVVISPGPGSPQEIPDLMDLVAEAIVQRPTLGICLGFQAIASYFGGSVLPGIPVHGKVCQVLVHRHGNLLKGLPDRFQVVRYHSLIVSDLKEPLIRNASTADDVLMVFEHKNLPVSGLQYHPEAYLSEFGIQVFQNWLDLC